MTPYVFHTSRLSCRRWLPEDFEALVRVYGDEDAMRWVGEGVAITPEQCRQWLEVTESNYRNRGYGMFALEDRSTSLVVGFCGLVHPGGQPDAEIKYAFDRQYWGRGLATEAARSLLAYGADAHQLPRIIATAAPGNHASHRVLLKAGMSPAGTRDNEDGTQTRLFVWQPSHQDNAA